MILIVVKCSNAFLQGKQAFIDFSSFYPGKLYMLKMGHSNRKKAAIIQLFEEKLKAIDVLVCMSFRVQNS